MLRPRWRKVLSDLWDSRARTLLVVASIAVGVFAVGMIAGAYVIIPSDMNASYSASNPANIELWTLPFDEGFVNRVQRMDGVQDAEARRAVTVRLSTGPEEWVTLELLAIPDFAGMRINQLVPIEGAAQPDDRELVLSDRTAEKLEVVAGDRLEIELPDGTGREMPVVGFVRAQNPDPATFMDDTRGFITFDTLDWLHQPDSFNRLYVTVAEAPNDQALIRQVSAEVSDQLEKGGREVFRTQHYQKDKHPMSSNIQAVLGVLGLLGVLIVFLSGSLIANTLSALLSRHLRQIGVMKLVGARNPQIIGMYLALILCFGLIALAIAVPLGGWGAYALAGMIAGLSHFALRGYRLVPLAVVLQAAIALIVPLLAGILPVLQGARATVQEAIGGSGLSVDRSAKNWIDHQLERVRWLSRPLLISLRNTFRSKGRLRLTLLTLALGGAIFVAVFNVQIALNQKIEQIIRYVIADVNLSFARGYRVEEVRRRALEVPGVERVEAWAAANAELLRPDGSVAGNTFIFAPPAGSDLIEPVLLHGRWLQPGDEHAITVNEAIWTLYPDLEVGDRLSLKIEGKEQDCTVVGIFQFSGVDMPMSYSTYEYLSRVLNDPYRAFLYRIVTAEHSLAYQKRLSAQLDSHFRDLGFQISEVEAGGTFVKTVTDMLGIVTTLLLIMALLTALVGSIGLAGTLSMNVMERTREIGVMRAIGAHNRIVIRLVVVEGLVIGLISFALATLLSFPITSALSNIISYAIFRSPADFAFTGLGLAAWFGVVLLMSTLSSAIPARSASLLTIREVLAYE
jgi:putative ABC transport system permease protein